MFSNSALRREITMFLSDTVPSLLGRAAAVARRAPLTMDKNAIAETLERMRALERMLYLMKRALSAGWSGVIPGAVGASLLAQEEGVHARLQARYEGFGARMRNFLVLGGEGLYTPGDKLVVVQLAQESALVERLVAALDGLSRAVDVARRNMLGGGAHQSADDLGVLRSASAQMDALLRVAEDNSEEIALVERVVAEARVLVSEVRPVAWVGEILEPRFILGIFLTPWQRAVYLLLRREGYPAEYDDPVRGVLERTAARVPR